MHGKSNADPYGQQLAAEVLLCLVIQRGSLHSVLDWVRMARSPGTRGVMISVALLNQVGDRKIGGKGFQRRLMVRKYNILSMVILQLYASMWIDCSG